MSDDRVNHPKHPSGVDCIDVVEHFNFNRGNAIKYIWRAGKKGDELEDLRKSRWYIDREIERLEREKREPEPERVFYFNRAEGLSPTVEPLNEGDFAVQMEGGGVWRFTGGEWAEVTDPAPSLWEKVDLSAFIKERDEDVKGLAERYQELRRETAAPAVLAHPDDLKEGDWVAYRFLGRQGAPFTDRLVSGTVRNVLWAAERGHVIRNRFGSFTTDVYDVRLLGRGD